MSRPFSRNRSRSRRGGFRLSRSISPLPSSRKRSWLQSSDRSRLNNRSPSPSLKMVYQHSPPRSRSRSPRHKKWSSRGDGGPPRITSGGSRPGEFRGKLRSRSRDRHRSLSPKPPPRTEDRHRPLKDRKISPFKERKMSPYKGRKMSPYKERKMSPYKERKKSPYKERKMSPYGDRSPGPPLKKKGRHSSPGPSQRRASLSPGPAPGMSFSVREGADRRAPPRHEKKEDFISARKVTSTKKKPPRLTLHKRFTMEDQRPFRLNMEDNITIAILRNANARASEEVTISRIFDSNLFKMVHKKDEGRRPIFDRQEILVWRHDDNVTDDPGFERRLIRVKGAGGAVGGPMKKNYGDKISHMTPDTVRTSFGLELSRKRSLSQSPQRDQHIRLSLRPDPKYETKFLQRMDMGGDSKARGKRGGDEPPRRHDKRQEDRREGIKIQSKDDTYDLRHALDRRRSDREEDDDPNAINNRNRRFPEDDRNVVVNRKLPRFDDSPDFRGGKKGHHDDDVRRFESFRGSRGGRSSRGRDVPRLRDDWSPQRANSRDQDRDRRMPPGRNIERRIMSISPVREGFRFGGGRVRGRGRGFGAARGFDLDNGQKNSSPPRETFFKYGEHDDRDLSPRTLRGGRGTRGGRISRGFGSKSFRGNHSRGRFFSRTFNFRARGRGRGKDRDRSEGPHSVEREWKHDLFDSLEVDGEDPHSTLAN